MKKCNKCGVEKDLSNYCKHSSTKDKLSNQCNDCKNAHQRKYRAKVGDIHTRRYEKTKSGFLVRLYRNMLSRVTGVQKEKYYLYEGVTILSKDDFYNWANSQPEFHRLFKVWEDSGFERRLTPSVDRINSRLGYEIGNMEWVELWVNCSRGAKSKKVNGMRKPQIA